jgi:hypothetical protein
MASGLAGEITGATGFPVAGAWKAGLACVGGAKGAAGIDTGVGMLPGAGVKAGFFFKMGLTGIDGRRGRAEPFADAASGFPQQGQNLMTISHSSQ